MNSKRDTFVFYRSFYEAINDLNDKDQLAIYKAVSELALNFNEVELDGLPKTIFKLIKPQIEANNRRYLNGVKGAKHGAKGGRPKTPNKTPKKPQKNPKQTPNDNVNVNVNVNDNVYRGFRGLSITREQCNKLLERGYSKSQIEEVLDAIENTKGAEKKYVSLYLTAKNWLERRHPEVTATKQVKMDLIAQKKKDADTFK